MVEHIGGTGNTPLRPTNRTASAENDGEETSTRKTNSNEQSVRVSGDLEKLVRRVKDADTVRKEKVHRVKELLSAGRLVTPETVRKSAEQIMKEGS